MAKLFINKDIAPDADKAKYWLTGEDSISFSDIQYFMDWMPKDDNRIDVEIHSCGGDCVEGYAIYDALRASGKEISCKVVGTCASMATVILLAAPLERRTAYQHAQLCIHNPYADGVSLKGKITPERLESIAADLKAEKEKMLALYVERTGQPREALEAQMATDSWFNPDKAIELGFISSVVPAISAKKDSNIINSKTNVMVKKEVKVESSLLNRLLRKCGYAKIEDVSAVAMVITTSTGDELNVEREEGEIQVGDPASPDGEHVLEDGRTVVVTDGVITEIREPGSEDDDVEALKARISELEAENEALKSNAKSDDDVKVLNAVKKAGGIDRLTKAAASKYVPAGRQATSKRVEVTKPMSKIERKLQKIREQRNKE
ncbi:Clp protease ClpP [Phocaeicola faecium]|uniref:ATP-dependent Clp protease proteolytic subunit n=1 Tax=Phocaeicola faecium TaxID=2762213 RepID=A0ABR8V9U9_9BACT|nr:ATP-dependent Clp protease proteolytic subunit [Phocaeicola faecium]MBD8001538.1 ATP-dependent Clp protease proteolytic subunit [Phocaeicola faecium]